MSQVYIVIPSGSNWNDLIVFLNEYDAKNYSLNNPSKVVRLFVQQNNNYGYYPSQKYYLAGKEYLPA